MKYVLFAIVLLGSSVSAETHREGGVVARPLASVETPSPERVTEEVCRSAFGANPDESDLIEFRDDALAARARLCRCLQSKGLPNLCLNGGSLDRWREILSDSVQTDPFSRSICGVGMMSMALEHFFTGMLDQCETRPENSLARFFREPRKTNGCWQVSSLDSEGCLEVDYVGDGEGDLSRLPVPLSGRSSHATLCNESLVKIHELKDPDEQNAKYQFPQRNFLLHGRFHNHVTYGPANCHGTAQAVVGPMMDETELVGVMFHSPQVEKQCGPLARQRFEAAKVNGKVTIGSIHEPQVSINMKHDSCDQSDCGKAKYNVFDCEGEDLIASAFVSDMCVSCWENKFLNRGYRKLGLQNSWQDLGPGCVLTQADHSITVLFQDCGICYYYESTTPHGPPQVRMHSCASLYSRFPRRLCPSAPKLNFDLK